MKQILALVLFIGITAGQINAQTNVDSAAIKKDFFLAAQNGAQEIGLLLPAVQKAREAAARVNNQTKASFLDKLIIRMRSAQSVFLEIKSAGERMTGTKLVILAEACQKEYQQVYDLASNERIMTPEIKACLNSCEDKYPIPGQAPANLIYILMCKIHCWLPE